MSWKCPHLHCLLFCFPTVTRWMLFQSKSVATIFLPKFAPVVLQKMSKHLELYCSRCCWAQLFVTMRNSILAMTQWHCHWSSQQVHGKQSKRAEFIVYLWTWIRQETTRLWEFKIYHLFPAAISDQDAPFHQWPPFARLLTPRFWWRR